MKKTLAGMTLVVGAMICTTGCTTYYKVTDPTTNKVYYTTDLKEKSGGAVQLKDARTGSTINLQNHEVEVIPKEKFESGKNAPPEKAAMPAAAAPAAAPSAPAQSTATAAPAPAEPAAANPFK